jgi:hypothetical protein
MAGFSNEADFQKYITQLPLWPFCDCRHPVEAVCKLVRSSIFRDFRGHPTITRLEKVEYSSF